MIAASSCRWRRRRGRSRRSFVMATSGRMIRQVRWTSARRTATTGTGLRITIDDVDLRKKETARGCPRNFVKYAASCRWSNASFTISFMIARRHQCYRILAIWSHAVRAHNALSQIARCAEEIIRIEADDPNVYDDSAVMNAYRQSTTRALGIGALRFLGLSYDGDFEDVHGAYAYLDSVAPWKMLDLTHTFPVRHIKPAGMAD